MTFEPFVDASEAGEFLKLHPVTVQRLARTGLLPGHPAQRKSRRHWRFLLSELRQWLKERSGAVDGSRGNER
jgi:hypothetical protein